MNEQPPPEAVVLRAMKELVLLPSPRDQQEKIGPSDMSDPCARCLAFKMAGTPLERGGHTLFAWNGTSTHLHMEQRQSWLQLAEAADIFGDRITFLQQVFGDSLTEAKVFVVEIPGYGRVSGHIDVLTNRFVIDWKTTSLKKVQAYQKQLEKGEMPNDLAKYSSQLTLYIGAARRLGYNIETGVLAFFPRDAITVDEFWTFPVTYSEKNEQALIQRTKNIFEYVKVGRHGEIASDPDCYTCHPRYYG